MNGVLVAYPKGNYLFLRDSRRIPPRPCGEADTRSFTECRLHAREGASGGQRPFPSTHFAAWSYVRPPVHLGGFSESTASRTVQTRWRARTSPQKSARRPFRLSTGSAIPFTPAGTVEHSSSRRRRAAEGWLNPSHVVRRGDTTANGKPFDASGTFRLFNCDQKQNPVMAGDPGGT